MNTTEKTAKIRDVLAIDGEGRDTPDGQHLYTLLLTHDTKVGKTRYIENWEEGLTTWKILDFLLWLRCGKSTTAVMYYGNYDVAMWIKDLPNEEKTILWKSGRLVTRAPGGRYYYLRYIPSKLFFVGDYKPEMGLYPNELAYPLRHLRIYDISGFAQKRFTKALEDWQIPLGNMEAMKERRGTFTTDDREEVTDYCEAECRALCQLVQGMDGMFQEEGIFLTSWHGGGALATYFMRKHGVQKHLADPEEQGAYDATLAAYFGGRTEICRMGHLEGVLNYDIASAYPAACLHLPDLATGTWQAANEYRPEEPYAIWHTRWDTRGSGRRLGPLPFRYRKGVYFPDVGSGWVHASEVQAAKRYFGDASVSVDNGWIYVAGGENRVRPFAFVRELAERRVQYKDTDPRRAVPYKYGLNSIYGKLAQHAVDEDKLPPFQCYYAAGFITALTRARLLDFIYADGLGDEDVVMLATDGVFCTKERSYHVARGTERLGWFGEPKTLEDGYFIQPGCWYSRDGILRSRGFGARSLDYERVRAAYRRGGIHGNITFQETRFSGLGAAAGRGDYGTYARWIGEERTLNFYPDRKFVAPGYNGMEESVALIPYDMRSLVGDASLESEPYVPASFRDQRGYIEHLDELLDVLYNEDQPDIESE